MKKWMRKMNDDRKTNEKMNEKDEQWQEDSLTFRWTMWIMDGKDDRKATIYGDELIDPAAALSPMHLLW